MLAQTTVKYMMTSEMEKILIVWSKCYHANGFLFFFNNNNIF